MRGLLLSGTAVVTLYSMLPGRSVPSWVLSLMILVAAAVAFRAQQLAYDVFPLEWAGYLTAYVAWGSMGLLAAFTDTSAARAAVAVGVAFGCVAFACAIVWFHRTRVVGVDRDWMIDATVVSTSLAIVIWTTLPVTRAAAKELAAPEQAALAVAALIHLSFFTQTARLLIITRWRAIRPYVGTTGGVLAIMGSVTYLGARTAGDDVPLTAYALWTLALIALAAVPLLPPAAYLRQGTSLNGRPYIRLGLAGASLMVGGAAVVTSQGIAVEQTVPAGGALLLGVLVVWRLHGLITANERAKDRMEKLAAEQSTLAELGRRSLEPTDVPTLLGWATERIRTTLKVASCEVLEGVPSPCDDIDLDHAVSAPIAGADGTYGLLVVRDERTSRFCSDEVGFVAAAAVMLAVAVDRIVREERMRHASLHDPLTSLPNRMLLHDRLIHALEGASRHEGGVALLFIDLDRFKEVNDRLGHVCGDELLVESARRLRSIARRQDTLARFGGDEFILVAGNVADEDAAAAVARRVVAALERPFVVGGEAVEVSASVGIAMAADRESAEELLRRADTAMYRAKDRGGARFELAATSRV